MYSVNLHESHFPAQADDEVSETTVGGVLRAQAGKTPGAEALVEADIAGALKRRWTYGELLADAERLARALLSRYRPGERIAVWAPNIPEWVILEYASGLAGLTLVTASPAYRPRELAYVLEQSGAVGLFIVKEHRGNPMAEIAAQVAAQAPAVREVVDLEDALTLYAGEATGSALPEVRPGDPVQIQYTSGTTGFPKGVVLHHRGITNNARFSMERMSLRRGDAVLNVMPLFHTAGCGLLTLGAVQFGGRLIVARLFEPARMLDIVEAEGVEFVLGVPTMLVALLEAQAAQPRDLRCVRTMGSGGAMVPPELARRVRAEFGCDFYIVYGQTESSCLLTITDAADCATVGQPLAQTEISIRHPRTNAVQPPGDIGEICARGYGVMLGYNDNPEATAATIDAEGWLHTGDLGALDARGYLKVTGRVKEMIIRGGENLFPAEIENVLLEHGDIAEAAVVGVPDERWGEIVVGFVRLATGSSLDRAALVAHCRERISPQKTPAHWIAVQDWPLTGSGKIQKFVLRDRFVAGEFEAV
ncbi:class I adenylate-forming enzyme family protein [Phenylobacterium sp.]|uniref:class I adenylate-forming enzyme family protein n=1 Tax=Phenylobacterium sp. TaxID=1871053 RepID=UPI002E36812B|nr:AMP-binding protein [Phenylobacterium sp.]HEX3365988.1 AMP-binding protein [Phenylobacterium sp.]